MAASRTRTVAAGGLALMLGQVVVAAAQLAYSGMTGRWLPAEAFGSFSIAISATGFAALLVTTGLASFVVSRVDLPSRAASAVVVGSWVAGFVAALSLLVLAPVWAHAWGAPDATPLTRLVSGQVLLASPSAVQSALLRREARPAADAAVQAFSAVGGLVAGTIAVFVTRDEVALAVSPTVAAAMGLVAAWRIRRVRYPLWPPNGATGSVARFSFQVSSQNIVFFAMASMPAWSVSVGCGQEPLGQFSRAVILTTLPATAVSNAVIRAVQPFYRQVQDQASKCRAVSDAAIATSCLAFPAFFGLAALAAPVVSIWLGTGWEQAATFVLPLALGQAIYVCYSVLANAAETAARFRAVRISQAWMLPVAIGLATVTIGSSEPLYGATIPLAATSVGLVALVREMNRAELISSKFLGEVMIQVAWAAAIALITYSATRGAVAWGYSSDAMQLVAGIGAGCLGTILSAPATPGWRVLRRRGLLTFRERK